MCPPGAALSASAFSRHSDRQPPGTRQGPMLRLQKHAIISRSGLIDPSKGKALCTGL